MQEEAKPEQNEQKQARVSRRAALIGGAAFAAKTVLLGTGVEAQQTEDPAALGHRWEREGITPGPQDEELNKIAAETFNLERSYLQARRQRTLSDTELADFRKQLYLLQLRLGARLQEYERQNGMHTHPTLETSRITDRFEDSVRAVDLRGLSPKQADDERRRLLEEYIPVALAARLYGTDGIEEDLREARVRGFYCGYMGVCPEGF